MAKERGPERLTRGLDRTDDSTESLAKKPRAYQLATRRIVRGVGTWKERTLAIVRLAERARNEPELALWCAQAVWVESSEFIRTGRVPKDPPSRDPATAACRSLRRKGYDRCPKCVREVPDAKTLDAWDGLFLQAMVEFALARDGVQ